MKNVLIITDRAEDYYYAPFLEACRQLGNPVNIYLFFWSEFPKNQSVSIELSNSDKIHGKIQVFDSQNETETLLPIESVAVAWFLRTHSIKREEHDDVTDEEFLFLQSESRATLKSVFSCMDCEWINKSEQIRFVETNKLYQQKIAQMCGIKTPATILSNIPGDIHSFEPEDKELLIKSVGFVDVDTDLKEPLFIYSNLVKRELLKQNSVSLQSCPTFIQKYIPKKYEHRVMVVGDEVLGCRIDSQASNKTKVDWRRYDFENVEHIKSELPTELKYRLLRFMGKIGLRYGAIDLIETPDGEFVFLEINPSGQWGWIDELANLDIPSSVVRMLIK